jgi:hypothetical protein
MEIDASSSITSPNPSIYIPVISKHINEGYVIKSFKDKNIGTVLRVDFVLNKEKFRREAFVHFSEWYSSEEAIKLKTDLLNPEVKSRFVHKGTNYWPILPNKNPVTRNSPDRKPSSTYELEDRLSNIERGLDQLSFVTKVHDANIRFILRKPVDSVVGFPTTQIKRQKTQDNGDSVKILRSNTSGNEEEYISAFTMA